MLSEGRFPGNKEEGASPPPVWVSLDIKELSSNEDHLVLAIPPSLPTLLPPVILFSEADCEDTTYLNYRSLGAVNKEQLLKDVQPLALYQAGIKGNWGAANNILSKSYDLIKKPLTEHEDTILHIAVANAHKYFVEKLVSMLDHRDLMKKNKNKDTALTLAAASGTIGIARVLVEKCKQLQYIRGNQKRLPVHMAILSRHSDMAWYLLELTNLDKNGLMLDQQLEILTASIRSEMFDVAIYLLENTPTLALLRDSRSETPLFALAQQPLHTRTYYLRDIWKTLARLGSKITQGKYNELSFEEEVVQKVWGQIMEQRVETIPNVFGQLAMLFKAAETGNLLVLAPIIRTFPDIVLRENEDKHTIFHVAIDYRQKEVFELIYKVGPNKHLIIAKKDNNEHNIMVLLAAKMAPPGLLDHIPGAALQMQMELMWFKAVRELVDPVDFVNTIEEGLDPLEKFMKEHKSLRESGEDWMRKTAESCNVVATLITTVAFSAIFSLPGGSTDSGEPHLLNRPLFITFAICIAISLFTSSTSIFIFLSILSSRYKVDEFLLSLPLKLMLGLTALFLSIAAMMGAFTAAFFITFRKAAVSWLPIPIALLAVVPVSLFAWQQSPLLLDVFRTTCGSKAFFRPGKCKLFKCTAIGSKKKTR